jgi:hypothetical protein
MFVLWIYCTNLFTCGPEPQINLIICAALNFLIDIRYSNARFYLCAVRPLEKTINTRLPLGQYTSQFLTSGLLPPTGEAGKNAESDFMGCSPVCPYIKNNL